MFKLCTNHASFVQALINLHIKIMIHVNYINIFIISYQD
jgi:hypothetical protein